MQLRAPPHEDVVVDDVVGEAEMQLLCVSLIQLVGQSLCESTYTKVIKFEKSFFEIKIWKFEKKVILIFL